MTTVLQFLLGAGVLSVLFTQLATSWRAWRERQRQRTGLLRIVYTEVAQNKAIIDYLAPLLNLPGTAKSALAMRGRYVRTEAWKEVRVELSRNCSSECFAALSDYYKNVLLLEEVVTLERARKAAHPNHETSSDLIHQAKLLVKALSELESEMLALIRDQAPDVTATDKFAELARNSELPQPPNSRQ
jgi:hypothetical protein